MIETVQLNKSEIFTSRLGFGTSRLHYLRSRRERQGLLAKAADLGIRHFDAAPAYGDGLAERELGEFLRHRRTEFVIVTKYGIPPSLLIDSFPPLGLPLRPIRAVLRRIGLSRRALPPLTAWDLRQSLQNSLRRMGIDRIDIMMLHEATLQRLPNARDLLEEFHNLRDRGLVKAFGLAGSWHNIQQIVTEYPDMAAVLQTGELEWTESDNFIPDITYGAIARGPQTRLYRDIATNIAQERVASALRRRPNGVLLVSTTEPGHLRLLAEVAGEHDS